MGVWKYLILMLLILAACETGIDTIPTDEYQKPVTQSKTIVTNPCDNVTCSEGKICTKGQCQCEQGTKECGSACISEKTCCNTSDCETGDCVNGECIQECEYGKEFKSEECKCTKDRFYCEAQSKCIERDSCCQHTECDNFERCVPTQLRARLCMEIEGKKICRLFGDNGREDLVTINDADYRISATNWWQDKSITFKINQEELRLANNQTKTISNISFYHESIEELGGFCKEDDAD